MSLWSLIATDKYERDFKYYEKKHPNELMAVLLNLDKYFSALNHLNNPMQIKCGYIHIEPHGIIASDQSGYKKDGTKKVKLQETRLYLYPDVESNVVLLLLIGNKNTQKYDIKTCSALKDDYINNREKS